MSLIPEIVFRTAINRGLQTFRREPKLIDQLFRNLDAESVRQIRDFVLRQAIYVDVNYPRSDLKLPAIVILLQSETEETAFL